MIVRYWKTLCSCGLAEAACKLTSQDPLATSCRIWGRLLHGLVTFHKSLHAIWNVRSVSDRHRPGLTFRSSRPAAIGGLGAAACCWSGNSICLIHPIIPLKLPSLYQAVNYGVLLQGHSLSAACPGPLYAQWICASDVLGRRTIEAGYASRIQARHNAPPRSRQRACQLPPRLP